MTKWCITKNTFVQLSRLICNSALHQEEIGTDIIPTSRKIRWGGNEVSRVAHLKNDIHPSRPPFRLLIPQHPESCKKHPPDIIPEKSNTNQPTRIIREEPQGDNAIPRDPNRILHYWIIEISLEQDILPIQ